MESRIIALLVGQSVRQKVFAKKLSDGMEKTQ